MNEEKQKCENCWYWKKFDEVMYPDEPPQCLNVNSENFGVYTDKEDGCKEWDG